MSEVIGLARSPIEVMREHRELSRRKKLAGDKYVHARALMGELDREGICVEEETFDILKDVPYEPPVADDKIDLLCP